MFIASSINPVTADKIEKEIDDAVSDKPWTAEPSGDGFYRVVNALFVVLAQKCVKEEAELFAAAPDLLAGCKAVLRMLRSLSMYRNTVIADEAEERLGSAVARAEGR